MLKTVTRALYIDGRPIAEYTQDPMADSELADIEQIAAQMELLERPKETQNRTYVSSNASNPFRPLGKGRSKALKFKLKLLQAVSKMLPFIPLNPRSSKTSNSILAAICSMSASSLSAIGSCVYSVMGFPSM